jgi:hypothetical protein
MGRLAGGVAGAGRGGGGLQVTRLAVAGAFPADGNDGGAQRSIAAFASPLLTSPRKALPGLGGASPAGEGSPAQRGEASAAAVQAREGVAARRGDGQGLGGGHAGAAEPRTPVGLREQAEGVEEVVRAARGGRHAGEEAGAAPAHGSGQGAAEDAQWDFSFLSEEAEA